LTTIYRIVFRPKAQRRFDRLDFAIRQQLARKLVDRARNPRVPGDALRGMRDCYKLKLRAAGVRAIYRVNDADIELLVLAVGSREGEEAYQLAEAELRPIE
jgi:mRNA interferase RelE/StbE